MGVVGCPALPALSAKKAPICPPCISELDLTGRVLDEAIALGAELIVTHHPILFRGRKNLRELGFDGFQLAGQLVILVIFQFRGVLVIIQTVILFNHSAQFCCTWTVEVSMPSVEQTDSLMPLSSTSSPLTMRLAPYPP